MTSVRPFRCLDRRALVTSLVVAAWLLLSSWFGHSFPVGSAPRIILGLGQAGALAALVLVLKHSISQLDELEQRIHYQALAIAGALIATAIGAWAFLEYAGLPAVDWSLYAMPAFTVAWASGVVAITQRYR
jgi:MFS family permease